MKSGPVEPPDRRVPARAGTLRDYLFVNQDRLDSYVDQCGGLPARKKRSRKLALSFKGPSAEMASEEIPGSGTYHDKIQFLIAKLLELNQLRGERPMRNTPSGKPTADFVLERMTATPVIIPGSKLPSDLRLSGLKIWISEPNPAHFDDTNEWAFSGSFVYLTELFFDDAAAHHFYSGCSALRFIANAATGQKLLERSGEEVFGRGNSRHPADKLSDIGGVKGDPRRIMSLYRIRYMSDEQVYEVNGSERRVHDILGYPLFIAAI